MSALMLVMTCEAAGIHELFFVHAANEVALHTVV